MATPGDYGWLTLWAGVSTYEVVALRRDWPLLSETMDRYRTSHPVLTELGIAYFAAHLSRRWPSRFDPLTQLCAWGRR